MVTTVNPLSSGFAYGCQEGETCRPIFKTNSGIVLLLSIFFIYSRGIDIIHESRSKPKLSKEFRIDYVSFLKQSTLSSVCLFLGD